MMMAMRMGIVAGGEDGEDIEIGNVIVVGCDDSIRVGDNNGYNDGDSSR